MKIRILVGAACAALVVPVVPASAATSPQTNLAQPIGGSTDQAVAAFYASRRDAPFWLSAGPDSLAARDLIGILQRSSLDGFAGGPVLAAQATSQLARAGAGDPAALANADRLLTTAWVMYIQVLQRPPQGMLFADSWVSPRTQSAQEILARAVSASSLAAHVRSASSPNPLYARIRETAWLQMQSTGSAPDPRVLANLDRIRAMPFQSRYIVVDAASARLWMVEQGQIVDSMKVIVGKPTTPTPMLASTIYYATLNPYWNVPPDLVRKLTAPKVLDQGVDYLKSHGYVVMTGYGDGAQKVDPTKVDWKAVAQGRATVAVRQLPGPANSMGQMKFGFPNQFDVYLHDTPQKELFAAASRDISNGCIRVEDAERLGRWLMRGDPIAPTSEPEQHVLLPRPVPVYLTYLTAQADGGQLNFVDDVYGRDSPGPPRVAAN